VRRKILRRRGVGFRLAFVGGFIVRVALEFRAWRFVRRRLIADLVVEMALTGEAQIFEMFARQMFAGQVFVGEMLARQMIQRGDIVKVFFVVQRERNFLAVPMCRVQCFAGQQFYGGSDRRRRLRGACRNIVGVAVVVVLEIFKNVADIQKSVAIEANFDERRLHSGKNAGDFSFVDAAYEGELFFALDVNLD
jgi:hypothetical protein